MKFSNECSNETILGVGFHVGTVTEAIDAALQGGLVLAPSGPGLAVDLVNSPAYRDAVLSAEVNLTDSGFMLLLWRWRTGRRLPRLSGLGYLQALLKHPKVAEAGGTFWVMPGREEQALNLQWLNTQGVKVTPEDCYLAPVYGAGLIEDGDLVARLRARRPRVVIIAIGGGVQERLGLALRQRLAADASRPGVVCIGAAIAFLSGAQVGIPAWADRWCLGWLCRIISSPRRYAPRYLAALRLAGLIRRHGPALPPLAGPR